MCRCDRHVTVTRPCRNGRCSPLTALRPRLDGIDPDDSFSSVPYEKGFNFLWCASAPVSSYPWAALTAIMGARRRRYLSVCSTSVCIPTGRLQSRLDFPAGTWNATSSVTSTHSSSSSANGAHQRQLELQSRPRIATMRGSACGCSDSQCRARMRKAGRQSETTARQSARAAAVVNRAYRPDGRKPVVAPA
jgi:hypothetical protein